MALIWSLAAIAVVFVLGDTLRLFLRKVLPRGLYECATDFISSFQLSACVFEISVIGNFYNGWVAVSCSFILLTLKNMEYIFDGAAANPCGLLERVVKQKTSAALLTDFLAKSISQLLGAMLSFPFIQTLWQYTSSEFHSNQLSKELLSTLEVSLFVGFGVEVGATFLSTMSDFVSRGNLQRYNPVIRSTACIVVCLMLGRTTGTWMNPALATVHIFMFSPSKELLMEHVFVFWVGPMLGTLIAISANSMFIEKPDPRLKRKSLVRKIKNSVEKNQKNGVLSLKRRKIGKGT